MKHFPWFIRCCHCSHSALTPEHRWNTSCATDTLTGSESQPASTPARYRAAGCAPLLWLLFWGLPSLHTYLLFQRSHSTDCASLEISLLLVFSVGKNLLPDRSIYYKRSDECLIKNSWEIPSDFQVSSVHKFINVFSRKKNPLANCQNIRRV